MVQSIKYIALFALLLALSACQKVIDLKLNSAAAQIVIEGNINNIKASQSVSISQSVPFTSTNNYPAISGATVTIQENKGIIYTLPESSIPGTYTINNIAGKPGSTYTLTVKTNGQTYTAVSTMPQLVAYAPLSFTNDAFNAGSKSAVVNFNDPPNVTNQYRFVLYVNGAQIKNIYVADDTFTDGANVNIDLYQNDVTIKTGDQVIVDSQGIDRNMFYYWYSLAQQQGSGVGGSAAPSNPPSNISNNALGYFSAHTSVIQTAIVK
jgi:hypothetical protein